MVDSQLLMPRASIFVTSYCDVSSISYIKSHLDFIFSVFFFLCFSGRRRLNIIKRNIQNLVACLFNVILHLQGPSIFYGFVDSIKAYDRPDPGSVILMCIELLTKLSGKSSSFQIDGCHIMQSVRVPGALFQYLLQHQNSGNPVKVDWKFSINLYDASCRMLCTALKHHKRYAVFPFDYGHHQFP